MNSTRREFLKKSVGASTLLAVGGGIPGFLSRTAGAATTRTKTTETLLVVIQLSGGNDGLNTVVPYEDDVYHRSRPTLRLTANQVHQLQAGLGLHPDMRAFHKLFQEGYLGIVQGVGYPNSKREHEEAKRDWQSARPLGPLTSTATIRAMAASSADLSQTGWIGRALDSVYDERQRDVPGVFVGDIKTPFSLQSERVPVPSLRSLDQWLLWPGNDAAEEEELGRLAQTGATGPEQSLLEFLQNRTLSAVATSNRLRRTFADSVSREGFEYPPFPLAQNLKSIAQVIRAELGIRIYSVELGGGGIGAFDTHAGQATNHGALLHELAESVSAFLADLRRDNLLDSVLLLTFSEFGRTLTENGRRGTGHGAAAPMFLAGGRLKGGLVGVHPSLTDLEADAPKFHTDFRRVYATVLERWLGFESLPILGEPFTALEGVIA